MAKASAGLLLYRGLGARIEVLLVHPGGPYWAKRDLGAWSIPKGEAEPGEDLLARAQVELREETGLRVSGPFTPLDPVRQSGKVVHAWAVAADYDVSKITSNTFDIEFPPRSGRVQRFPEVDRADWFDLVTARKKILSAQRRFLDELEHLLSSGRADPV
jgi:predicted NUDIX family NTP pyrophosphohydrolase